MSNLPIKKADGTTVFLKASGEGTDDSNAFVVEHHIALPTGAATAAKQPALGTAGTASSDVITVQGIASMTPLSVTYTPSQVRISATLTRPSDTSAYAAKDAIANSTSSPSVITLSGVVASAGQSAYITRALCRTSQTTFTGQLRLHLYDTAPTAINDNAQFTILDANTATYLGFIDFLVFSTEGTGSDVAQAVGVMDNNGNLPIITNGATAIYGMLETITAFTPANAQVFKFTLIFDRG